jgi:enoyl-CoA hydratase/carnithine racemase
MTAQISFQVEDRIRVDIADHVADVRLIRSDKMNALDDAMFNALIATGERLKCEPGVRAVVLSGEGRAFCAGLDMGNFARMAGQGEDKGDHASIGGARLANRTHGRANRAQYACLVWRDVPAPVIAAIHGVALGGGLQVALGADVRIVAPDAKLSVLEIKWGLIPDMGGMMILRRLLREDVFRELTFTGRMLTGEEAVQVGIATRTAADPLAEARTLAAEIAQKSPDAIRAGKRLLELAANGTDHQILQAESDEQDRLIGSRNQIEAVMANLQKRSAVFVD